MDATPADIPLGRALVGEASVGVMTDNALLWLAKQGSGDVLAAE